MENLMSYTDSHGHYANAYAVLNFVSSHINVSNVSAKRYKDGT
jgi:hypothetical protein